MPTAGHLGDTCFTFGTCVAKNDNYYLLIVNHLCAVHTKPGSK